MPISVRLKSRVIGTAKSANKKGRRTIYHYFLPNTTGTNAGITSGRKDNMEVDPPADKMRFKTAAGVKSNTTLSTILNAL